MEKGKDRKENRKKPEGGEGDAKSSKKAAETKKVNADAQVKSKKEKPVPAVENGSAAKPDKAAKGKVAPAEKTTKKVAKAEGDQASGAGSSSTNTKAATAKKNVKPSEDKDKKDKDVAAKRAKQSPDDDNNNSDSDPAPAEVPKTAEAKVAAKGSKGAEKASEDKTQKTAVPASGGSKKTGTKSKGKLDTASAEPAPGKAKVAEVPKGTTPELASGDQDKKIAKAGAVVKKQTKVASKSKSGSSSDEGSDKLPAKNAGATNGMKRKGSDPAADTESDNESVSTAPIDEDKNGSESPEAVRPRRSGSGSGSSPPPAKKEKGKAPEREVKNSAAATTAKKGAGIANAKTKKVVAGAEAAKGSKEKDDRKSYGLRSKAGGTKVKYGP